MKPAAPIPMSVASSSTCPYEPRVLRTGLRPPPSFFPTSFLTSKEPGMPDTLIKVDLSQSPVENENIHNRWHPDIPMACWVNPGDDFVLETFDWTGGFIKNNDSADAVRDIDLSTVHYLSGPVGVKG